MINKNSLLLIETHDKLRLATHHFNQLLSHHNSYLQIEPFLVRKHSYWLHLGLLNQFPHSWWCHQMETFSALLAICAGNSLVTGEFPTQRAVTWSFDVFFDLRLNKCLSKQSWGWWFETCPLWCHCNVRNFISFFLVIKMLFHNLIHIQICQELPQRSYTKVNMSSV